MNIFRILTIITIILFISSCSIPLTISLFNNSPTKIELIFNHKKIIIKPGTSEKFTGLEYSKIKINTDMKTYNYDSASVQYNNFEFVGWGPFTKRIFFAQFETNGKIWVTNEQSSRPIKVFKNQPKGFPLIPIS